MAFKHLNANLLINYNSDLSKTFLSDYTDALAKQISEDLSRLPSKTFAPSSVRCKRKSWFRLRGVQPDTLSTVDLGLDFSAMIGTACHRYIQNNLYKFYGVNWIKVSQFLQDHPIKYEYSLQEDADTLETKVQINNPPVKFACDGILKIEDKYYILEIKTCDIKSLKQLNGPKPIHIDQVTCYGTLLGIADVLFVYQDRQYGDIKVFEYHITSEAMNNILKMFNEVQIAVMDNIAPARLADGDYECTNCPYKLKCREWGE